MTGSLTLAEVVAGRLREAITLGALVSGERVIESKLAQKWGVSQNTVRDALRLLEQEGWIVHEPRRGASVRRFTLSEAAEVYDLILAVEGVALDGVIARPDRALENALQQRLHEARKAAHYADMGAAVAALIGLHRLIGVYGGGALTAELLDRLLNQARLLEALRQARTPRRPQGLQDAIDAHQQWVAHISAGDRDAAHAALAQILDEERAACLAALDVS